MWARISIFIVAALMVAAAGGAWFGHLLVQQAPKSPVPAAAGSTPIAIGLNGGQVPEPPQPRLDGSLGIPERAPAIPVPEAPLVSILDDKNVPIPVSSASSRAGSKEDDLEALLLRENNFLSNNGAANATPPASAGVSQPPPGAMPQPAPRRDGELPPELAFAVALPADAPVRNSNSTPAWLGNLRASLARCTTQRYFSQNECEQRLRLQHCEPNRGWGQVPECPAYLRNTRF